MISLNLVGKFLTLPKIEIPVDTGVRTFSRKIYDTSIINPLLTRQGFEVEGTTQYGAGFDDVVVGRIQSAVRHPNADKLQVCQVEVAPGLVRQIVCGAPNAREGLFVAVALPGASLPGGLNIKESKIRDVASCGMLCSRAELGLSVIADVDGNGIWELDVDAQGGTSQAILQESLGLPVFDALQLRDTLLEISFTPNRPDARCHRGIARELEAGFAFNAIPFQTKKFGFSQETDISSAHILVDAWNNQFFQAGGHSFSATSELGAAAFFVGLEGLEVKPSPAWLRNQLECLGQSSINATVDATNLVLLLWGQPSHAFDLEKLNGNGTEKSLCLRTARENEVFLGLDAKERVLSPQDHVVADAKEPQALLGVIGGEKSKVAQSTRAVALEFANPHPVAVRRMSRRHGRITDSSQAFEKGIDSVARWQAASELLALLLQLNPNARYTGACHAVLREQNPDAKAYFDADYLKGSLGLAQNEGKALQMWARADGLAARALPHVGFDAFGKELHAQHTRVFTSHDNVRYLGAEIVPWERQKIALSLLGFDVKPIDEKSAQVFSPHWRWGDVFSTPDLCEEVVRLAGIDSVPTIPMPMDSHVPPNDPHLAPLQRLSNRAASLGYVEVANYHLMRLDDLSRLGLSGGPSALGEPLVVLNPIIRDEPLMHTTLLPDLLRKVVRNLGFGIKMGRLFHSCRTYVNMDMFGAKVLPDNGEGFGVAKELGTSPSELAEYAPQWGHVYTREPSQKGRPTETPRLAGVVWGKKSEKTWLTAEQDWTLHDILAHVSELGRALDVALRFEPMSAPHPMAPALHPGRSARVLTDSGEAVGWVGVLHPSALRAFECDTSVMAFEINSAQLLKASARVVQSRRSVQPIRFPSVSRDFAFLLGQEITAGQIRSTVDKALQGLPSAVSLFRLTQCVVFDIFRGTGVPEDKKSLAFRLTLEPTERTLTDAEIQSFCAAIIKQVTDDLKGDLRG